MDSDSREAAGAVTRTAALRPWVSVSLLVAAGRAGAISTAACTSALKPWRPCGSKVGRLRGGHSGCVMQPVHWAATQSKTIMRIR